MHFQYANTLTITGKKIGDQQPVFIVAEAGVAHFGSFEKALKLVDIAKEAKADAVKFQIFSADELFSSSATNWKARLKSRELPYNLISKISEYCKQKEIIFFATAHDELSLEYLQTLDPPVLKIGSGERGNWDFIGKIASLGKPVIISTGMYEWEDIEKLDNCLRSAGNPQIALMHCVTSYPTPPEQVNLKSIGTLKEKLGCVVGYSDHTSGWHIPIAAVAVGARIIEKHISIDFDVPNAQDWKVSCDHKTLKLMVEQIRQVEVSLGTTGKTAAACEKDSIEWACKSLVAKIDISPGTTITKSMLTVRRPGTGIVPEMASTIIGRKALRKIRKNTILAWEDIKE